MARRAAREEDLATVRRAVESGRAEDLIQLFEEALSEDHMPIVYYLLHKLRGQAELDAALLVAAQYNRLLLVDELLGMGARDVDGALLESANSEPQTVEYLLARGPTPAGIVDALEKIEELENLEVFLDSGEVNVEWPEMRRYARRLIETDNWDFYEQLLRHGYIPSSAELERLFAEIAALIESSAEEEEESTDYWISVFDRLAKATKDEEKKRQIRNFLRKLKKLSKLA